MYVYMWKRMMHVHIWRRIMYVFIAFSQCWNEEGLEANESWSENKLTVPALIKTNLWFARPSIEAMEITFKLHLLYQYWSYWIFVFRPYQKNIAFSILNFLKDFILLFFLFFNTRLLLNRILLNTLFKYKQNFIEYAFQVKI